MRKLRTLGKRPSVRIAVALALVLGLAVLVTTATAGRTPPGVATVVASAASEAAVRLEAPLPPPEAVFVQRTERFPELGNVLVSVQLSAADLERKRKEGTSDFVTIGGADGIVILRDDGRSVDEKGGDGLFTGIATVEDAELEDRARNDAVELERNGGKGSPVFAGRRLLDFAVPETFDIEGFKGGKAVRLEPAAAFIDEARSELANTRAASGLARVGAAVVDPLTTDFQDRVLMIRHASVVTDPVRTFNPCAHFLNGLPVGNPNGRWTFKHLVTEMANQAAAGSVSGISPQFFVEEWLKSWVNDDTINADDVPNRAARMNAIIAAWKAESGGVLDLNKAPFRLLAIVPRVDLRTTTSGGGGYATNVSGNFLDAGEARFVFGVVLRPGWSGAAFESTGPGAPIPIPGTDINPSTNNPNDFCRALRFSVIFEYRVPKCQCEHVRGWAQSWMHLATLVPGTAEYNSHLQSLTDQFVRANANPTRPNRNALGQLRTNELPLGPAWELREFQLSQFPFTLLEERTTADTPNDIFENTGVFQDWVLNHVAPALVTPPFDDDQIPPVPLLFATAPFPGHFMGANPQVPNPGFHWRAPGLNLAIQQQNWARHRASLAACNGCHASETGTIFTHVDPASTTPPAGISGFLSGIAVNDPAHGSPTREFDDLDRREKDIRQVARLTCFGFRAINASLVEAALIDKGELPEDLFEGRERSDHHHDLVSVAVDDMRRNPIFEVH